MKKGTFIPISIVVLVGLVFYVVNLIRNDNNRGLGKGQDVSIGKDYYVVVTQMEIKPHNKRGKLWDKWTRSGPDIYYHIIWQDNIVFRSSAKEDTLIASWLALEIDLKDAILRRRIPLDSVVKAAILHAYPGSKFIVRIYDDDALDDDDVGWREFSIDNLHEGDNTFHGKEDNSIKRMNIRVIDKSRPISEVIEQLTRP